eukprot:950900-Pleurochrysis_carterae.AAC.1
MHRAAHQLTLHIVRVVALHRVEGARRDRRHRLRRYAHDARQLNVHAPSNGHWQAMEEGIMRHICRSGSTASLRHGKFSAVLDVV